MSATYALPQDFAGYEAGTELREVTLAEARAMECNRCGDCCSGMRDGVKKDKDTGLPLVVWGSKYPEDLYEARYGERMLRPIVLVDGGPVVAKAGQGFETDADGKPYTAFSCAFLEEHHDGTDPEAGPETSCGLMCRHPRPDPQRIEQIRPRACGEFPVFGLDIDAALIGGQSYIPATGNLPRCTWYGLRVVGPWKTTGTPEQVEYWRERWERQQRGEPVQAMMTVQQMAELAERLQAERVTEDGSMPR